MFISLWGGSIRFNTPMLFVMAFLPMFGIGGLTGLPLGLSYSDIHLHDTYYVIAHFHYIVAPGTIFALFAGIYYWFPKMTGRMMNEFWGRVHFWLSLIFMNLIFQPMFAQGMAGMLRRMADGGANYSQARVRGRHRRPEPGDHGPAHLHPLGGGRPGASRRFPSSSISSGASSTGSRRARTIPGKPPPWNGRRPRRRRTAISPSRPRCIAGRMNTACRAMPRISRRRTEPGSESWTFPTQFSLARTRASTTPRSASGSSWLRR